MLRAYSIVKVKLSARVMSPTNVRLKLTGQDETAYNVDFFKDGREA